MKKTTTVLLALTGALFFLSTNASAIAILDVDSSGQLLGAKGVVVGENTYDVEFTDGAYWSLFEFGHTFGYYNAALASQALLDQVLLDTEYGLFDSNPSLTKGIETTRAYGGVIFTPHSRPFLNSGGSFQLGGWAARNTPTIANDEIASWAIASSGPSFNSTNMTTLTYAVWTQSAAPVPEPGTFALLLAGLLAVVTYKKTLLNKNK